MALVIKCSNIVATTPVTSSSFLYRSYNSEVARGVIFDKAATLFCSDSLLVLGNTPRPMIMFGDTKQLAPVLRQEGVEERDLGLECREPGEGNVISPYLDNAADRYWNLAKDERLGKNQAQDCGQQTDFTRKFLITANIAKTLNAGRNPNSWVNQAGHPLSTTPGKSCVTKIIEQYNVNMTLGLGKHQVPANRGVAFPPTIRFKNENERNTALTQTHRRDKDW
ncbi:hypothetical protein FOZG_07484 [Fusarium oxysporum Fo47]|uniref:DNA2/NAM7 helicase helicase domain-containing protein n=1 Tax=Fusarium oxysporum Fo47 TaxID=660027 RepID=W9KE25_FUSOX|nr:hypothetical protein FOZG_07484 [Fusarium oxysporum Fo47]